jgi:hypothetical protein
LAPPATASSPERIPANGLAKPMGSGMEARSSAAEDIAQQLKMAATVVRPGRGDVMSLVVDSPRSFILLAKRQIARRI